MSRQTRGAEPSEGFEDGNGAAALAVELPDQGPNGSRRADRASRRSGAKRSRPNPARFFREVRNELRQVAWPTRAELINYTTVVLTVLVIMIALIFALNYGFGKLVLWLFQK